MPTFAYQALDGAGRRLRGSLEARSLAEAVERLNGRGLHPFETRIAGEGAGGAMPWWRRDLLGPRPLPHTALQQLTHELATLVGADLALDDALRLVALQMPAGRARAALEGVLKRVVEGASLSDALAAGGPEFPAFYVGMLRAGEAAGALGPVLEELSTHLERMGEIRGRIASALVYPIVLMVMALAAVSTILLVLVPSLAGIFADAGRDPPATIAVMLWVRSALSEHWDALLGAAGVALLLAAAALRDKRVRQLLARLALRLPLAGRLIAESEAARFARVLATLLRSGVALVDGLAIAGGLVRNSFVAERLLGVVEKVRRGAGLARPLAEAGVLPQLMLRMAVVGEESGQIERMLLHAARVHEQKVGRAVERLVGLLTPALTILIGLGVGSLVMSVMNAVLSVNEMVLR